MKKLFTILALLIAVMLAVPPVAVTAAQPLTFSLRIEGADKNLFYDDVTVTADSAKLNDVLTALNAQHPELAMQGIDAGYITSICGQAAGSFGGYDGWMFAVNGTDSPVGIADCTVAEGDEIVFYYGDPFGRGMQHPVVFADLACNGILRIMSVDTVYDASYNATLVFNPVANAQVYVKGGAVDETFVTDEKGQITVCQNASIPAGNYNIQVTRADADGCPTALRLKPDYTFVCAGGDYGTPGIDDMQKITICFVGNMCINLSDIIAPGAYGYRVFDSKMLELDDSAPVQTGVTFTLMAGDAVGMPLFKLAVAGDVNCDGKLTTDDARDALRAAVGLQKLTLAQTAAADADIKDGETTTDEARKLLRVAVGLDSYDSLTAAYTAH